MAAMATLVSVPPQGPGKSDESGKSRLLVSEKMATRVSTGDVDVRRLQRTIIPVPYQALAGVDDEGNPTAMDMDLVEKNLELYSLLIEYSQTPIYSPEGVYCMPAWNNLRVWDGVILLRHGLYQGGMFKFKISIDTGYPVTPPSITFLSRVYHPLIDPETGELSIKPQFHSWNGEKDYLPMLLMYLKSIFYKKEFLHGTDMEDMWLNVEAANAFRGEKKPVLDSIRECVRESQANIYTKIDGFVFNFTEFHREKKPILQALNVLAHDVTCVDPKEAFVDWFLDDWCKKEFDGDKDAVESATAEPHKA